MNPTHPHATRLAACNARERTDHRGHLVDTMMGATVHPCGDDSKHDWHSDGRTWCPGVPNVLEGGTR